MKKTLLTIALAVATVPFAFAQAPANPPAAGGSSSTPAATTSKTKSKTHHTRKAGKKPVKNSTSTGTGTSK